MTDLEKRADEYAIKVAEKNVMPKDGFAEHLIRQAYLDATKAETALFSQHIIDLQKDKGNLTDRVRELETQIEKMKWHKVSDGDFPKDRHNVYVVYMNGYCQLEKTIASFRHKYWVINGLKTECEIIAWCELPKWETKEND